MNRPRPPVPGVTLTGEIVEIGHLVTTPDHPPVSHLTVRWQGVTITPALPDPHPPKGLRALTTNLRRLLTGPPPGRHRAP